MGSTVVQVHIFTAISSIVTKIFFIQISIFRWVLAHLNLSFIQIFLNSKDFKKPNLKFMLAYLLTLQTFLLLLPIAFTQYISNCTLLVDLAHCGEGCQKSSNLRNVIYEWPLGSVVSNNSTHLDFVRFFVWKFLILFHIVELRLIRSKDKLESINL